MLGYLFIFLPLIACLVGSLMFLFRRDKSFAQLHFSILLFVLALYFFSDGVYLLKTPDYHLLIYADILSQFVSASIPFLTYVFLKSMYEHVSYGETILLFFIPGMVMGLGSVAFYSIIGIDDCAEFLRAVDMYEAGGYTHRIYSALLFWTDTFYSMVMAAEFLVLFVWQINTLLRDGYEWGSLIKFFRRKSTISSSHFETIVFMLIIFVNGIRLMAGRTYLIEHPVFSGIMSFLTALMLASAIDIAYWYKITNGYITEFQNRASRKKIVKPELLLPPSHTDQELDSLPLIKLMFENCGLRIYNLFEVEKVHLKGSLTLKEASEITGLSKRNIIATIASLCQCNFRDLTNYYLQRDLGNN